MEHHIIYFFEFSNKGVDLGINTSKIPGLEEVSRLVLDIIFLVLIRVRNRKGGVFLLLRSLA